MEKFQAKKSLGQNFLQSFDVIEKIIEVSDLDKNSIVLEIGPGLGVLTKALLGKAGSVFAIEKDARLISKLNQDFAKEIAAGKLTLIEGDVLRYNFKDLLAGKNYQVVANIPYYITGQIIRTFLVADHQPKAMTLMLQKEVAERIVAKDGKESLLSLSVKAYGEPKYEFSVGKEEFKPVPKVDSAVLTIKKISRDFFDGDPAQEKRFFSLIKQGFSSKRRKLANNLQTTFKNKEDLTLAFEKIGLDQNIRPEKLTLNEWKQFLN